MSEEKAPVAVHRRRGRRFPRWHTFARWITPATPDRIGGDGAPPYSNRQVPAWRKLASVLGDSDRVRAGVPVDATELPTWTTEKTPTPPFEEAPAWW